MSAVYLVVGLRAKPEKIDQVRSDLIEVVAPSRKESGCNTHNLQYRTENLCLITTH
ncbi:putative quinol monooxygenase, partial [Acinetobacter baumannii]|uniref:putative quinol monooxygenase n=1 Tax=Acinetobacter baumannii TaxID=470 RepID=UPI003AB6E0EC